MKDFALNEYLIQEWLTRYAKCPDCGRKVRHELIQHYQGFEYCPECYKQIVNGDD